MPKSNIKAYAFLSFFNQFVILVLGIVIPRFVMMSYGSEINGLVNTVTQIFTYVALLEAGIGNAAVNALYKPIVNGDKAGVCDVFSAAQKYFRKVTVLYAGCVIAVALLYPLVAKTELDYKTIALVILLQGASGVIGFFFSAAYTQVLIADGKYYITTTVKLVIYIISTVGKIVLMSLGYDVVMLMVWNLIISSLQILLILLFMRRKYPYLKRVSSPDMSALKERKAFVVHEMSTAIFSSTDVIILSTFCDIKLASVYSVYNLVFHSLSNLINSVNSSVNHLLGHAWARGDKNKYTEAHDVYESVYIASVFSIFTVAYVLILPFVSLYTSGVNDIPYVDHWLPILFVTIQLLSCVRAVASRLITISGHAAATQSRSMLEAAINLVASIVLVFWFDIYGVLMGTVVALLYRSNDIIVYANRKILSRSPWKTYKKVVAFVAVFTAVAVGLYYVQAWLIDVCNNYLMFVLFGAVFMIISIALYAVIALLTEKGLRNMVKHSIQRKVMSKLSS